MKEPDVFRNNAEMMAYLRGKVEKLEPNAVRDVQEDAKPKKKRRKKEKTDVDKTE